MNVAERNDRVERVRVLTDLRTVAHQYRYARDRRRRLAREARSAGATWQQVANALGVKHNTAVQLVRRQSCEDAKAGA